MGSTGWMCRGGLNWSSRIRRTCLRCGRRSGASRRDDGYWTLPPLSTELASPDAALHIGPQHVVLETAAIDFAADRAGTRRLQVVSWHVMFMARGKVGPFRAEGSAYVGGGPNKVGVRMLLHDEGDGGDKAITSAAAVLEIV